MRPLFTCGRRVPGLYLCEYPENEGIPVEMFIPCPPIYVDMENIGLSATGMRLIERVDSYGNKMGIWDVWDYVSSADNPYVPDFIEQTRYFGTSRRFPSNLTSDKNFSKLKADEFDPNRSSRHIYVHSKGLIADPSVLYFNRLPHTERKHYCPAAIEGHDYNDTTYEFCAALWYEMVGEMKKNAKTRRHEVLLPRNWDAEKDQFGNPVNEPSCGYEGWHLPKGVKETDLTYMTAIIMSIPIMRMEIPTDLTEDREHERLASLLENGGWQYSYEITED